MHDFKALPHIDQRNSNPNSSHQLHHLSKICSTMDGMNTPNDQHGLEIPDWYQEPLTPYKIALIGFLEAQGINVYDDLNELRWESRLDYRTPELCQCVWEDGAHGLLIQVRGGKACVSTLYRRAMSSGFCSWCDIPF